MPMANQADRRSGLRPVKCTKKSKQSQEQCRNWAVIGTSPPICRIHGGARGAVKDKADLAVVAAQLGAVGLAPAETIKVVQRAVSDQFLRAAGVLQAAAAEGRPVDAEEFARYEKAADQALAAARIAMAAGVEDQDAEDLREEGNRELVATALRWTIDAVLHVLRLPGQQRLEIRDYAFAMSVWALEGGDPRTRPEEPKLAGMVDAQPVVVRAELMPAPFRRRSAPDADSVWSAAQQIVDAEVVDDEEDGDDDVVADSG